MLGNSASLANRRPEQVQCGSPSSCHPHPCAARGGAALGGNAVSNPVLGDPHKETSENKNANYCFNHTKSFPGSTLSTLTDLIEGLWQLCFLETPFLWAVAELSHPLCLPHPHPAWLHIHKQNNVQIDFNLKSNPFSMEWHMLSWNPILLFHPFFCSCPELAISSFNLLRSACFGSDRFFQDKDFARMCSRCQIKDS